MGFEMNLQLFGGRGGSSGSSGVSTGGGRNGIEGSEFVGNIVPEDDYDKAILQNVIDLRKRWGRSIGSNNPNDHLVGRYIINEYDNGKQRSEYFIGTRIQLSDELDRRRENHGMNIRSRSSKYIVSAYEDFTHNFSDGAKLGYSAKEMDKLLDGDQRRKEWKKGKVFY